MSPKEQNSQLRRIVTMLQTERNYREKSGQIDRAKLVTEIIELTSSLMIEVPKPKKA